jgi:hypothetical protein
MPSMTTKMITVLQKCFDIADQRYDDHNNNSSKIQSTMINHDSMISLNCD